METCIQWKAPHDARSRRACRLRRFAATMGTRGFSGDFLGRQALMLHRHMANMKAPSPFIKRQAAV
jgi:hypothetical protein